MTGADVEFELGTFVGSSDLDVVVNTIIFFIYDAIFELKSFKLVEQSANKLIVEVAFVYRKTCQVLELEEKFEIG